MDSGIRLTLHNYAGIKSGKKMETGIPLFAKYKPPIRELADFARKLSGKKQLVLVGHGGRNTSFKAIAGALKSRAKKGFFVLLTMEPEIINWVKKNFSKKRTVVVAVSKSGTNVDSLEPLFALKGYETVVVTQLDFNPMHQYALFNGLKIVEHPDIG